MNQWIIDIVWNDMMWRMQWSETKRFVLYGKHFYSLLFNLPTKHEIWKMQTSFLPFLLLNLHSFFHYSFIIISHHITTHHITSHHITSYYNTSHHTTSHHITSHTTLHHIRCIIHIFSNQIMDRSSHQSL